MSNDCVMSHQQSFMPFIRNKPAFKWFLLKKLPAAFFSGVGVQSADNDTATATVKYKWFTRNPFRSTYFACLAMAAELSTGLLAMMHVYKRQPAVSMLVTGIKGNFYKKAISTTYFTCNEGGKIKEAIDRCIAIKEPQTIEVAAKGLNENNELVAVFYIEWSFKAKG